MEQVPIEDLSLSSRAYNILFNQGFIYVDDIPADFLVRNGWHKVRGMGDKVRYEIAFALEPYAHPAVGGLSLSELSEEAESALQDLELKIQQAEIELRKMREVRRKLLAASKLNASATQPAPQNDPRAPVIYRLYEKGVTQKEIAAIFGIATVKVAHIYTREKRKRRSPKAAQSTDLLVAPATTAPPHTD